MKAKRQQLGSTGGVVLRRDLLAMGYDDRAIARMLRANDIVRIRQGSYVSAESWACLSPEDRHRVRARAVLRTAKSPMAVSHVSGALEWDADTWDLDLSEVHVTRRDTRSGRREAGVVQHRGAVPLGPTPQRDGVPVLGAARTVVDVTRMTDVPHGLVVTNSMLHRGATTLEECWAASQAMDGWPDTLTTRIVLSLADPRIESVAESLFVHVSWQQGLPRAEPQVKICDSSGRVVARVDFALPDLGVFFEIDGRVKYDDLPPGKTLKQVLREERDREKLVCRLTGWICIRITWRDLQDPVRLAHEIRAVLSSRRGYGRALP